MLFYIASQDVGGGVLLCRLAQDGQIGLLETYPLDRPAFLAKDGDRLFALLREPFLFQSGVAEYAVLPDGTLKQEGDIQPVFGTIAAHILRYRGRTYIANYCSSGVSRLPDMVMPFPGRSVDPERQTCSHPHCLTPSPEGVHICICDLGTDCIYVCDLNLKEVFRVKAPAGAGPRHLVFSPDGRFGYCVNEMGSSVSVYAYEYGRLTLLNTVSTLPEDFDGISSGSAIRISPDGKKLYVSNRGHDSVTEFAVEGEKLMPRRWIPCHGQSPREMHILGKFLLCGNEVSHNVTVFDLEGDISQPVCTFPVTRPWCIVPA